MAGEAAHEGVIARRGQCKLQHLLLAAVEQLRVVENVVARRDEAFLETGGTHDHGRVHDGIGLAGFGDQQVVRHDVGVVEGEPELLPGLHGDLLDVIHEPLTDGADAEGGQFGRVGEDEPLDEGADPDVWVIALGTNDIAKYASSEEYGEVVQQLLDLLPADAPLVWVDAYRDDYRDDSVLFDDTPGTGDLHAQVEQRDDVRRALDGIAALPLQQREALLGVAVQGRRHRDVGAELGVTDGAVRMLLHRARSTMRTRVPSGAKPCGLRCTMTATIHPANVAMRMMVMV